jgi:2-dehydro-3-deoxyglucarate aldolase/4-hydroxy-2-oxoheptanedioate aldolase
MKGIVAEIEEKIRASGKVMATVSSDFADAAAKFARGYGLVSLVHDTTSLGRLAREELGKFRRISWASNDPRRGVAAAAPCRR